MSCILIITITSKSGLISFKSFKDLPSSPNKSACDLMEPRVDVEVTGLPFTSEGKSAVLAVFRDITEKKQAREALRKAEKRLRTVVASASLILFATDKNGVFTLCEGEGLKSLSLEPGELVGQSVFEVYADSPKVGENITARVERRVVYFVGNVLAISCSMFAIHR